MGLLEFCFYDLLVKIYTPLLLFSNLKEKIKYAMKMRVKKILLNYFFFHLNIRFDDDILIFRLPSLSKVLWLVFSPTQGIYWPEDPLLM